MEVNLGYIAGFFDGEGHISVSMGDNHIRPHIQIGQAGARGKVLLEELQTYLQTHGISMQIHQHKQRVRRKPVWVLQTHNRQATMNFARLLLPHLRVKKAETQDVLRFLSLYPTLRGSGDLYKAVHCGH